MTSCPVKSVTCSNGRTGRGGRGAAATQNLGYLDFLGSKRNLGKANFNRSFHVCVRVVVAFFWKIDTFRSPSDGASISINFLSQPFSE